MKARITSMVAMVAIAISASALPYDTAREEALFLSDKMAYELDLTESQYEAVYEINLDYLLNIDTRFDALGTPWKIRNRDLRHVLNDFQYGTYLGCEWFYRPIAWNAGNWSFSIYKRYDRGRLFMHHPAVFINFRGGHSHKDVSFYARHRFDRPNHPVIHHRHDIDRDRPVIVITDRHHSKDNRSHRTIGTNNRTPMVISFGNRHHDTSASAPNRSFGSHHHDKMDRDDFKDRDKDAPHRHFGGGRR